MPKPKNVNTNRILLFRIPTREIMEELYHRSSSKTSNTLKEISTKELLEFVLSERMDTFE